MSRALANGIQAGVHESGAISQQVFLCVTKKPAPFFTSSCVDQVGRFATAFVDYFGNARKGLAKDGRF